MNTTWSRTRTTTPSRLHGLKTFLRLNPIRIVHTLGSWSSISLTVTPRLSVWILIVRHCVEWRRECKWEKICVEWAHNVERVFIGWWGTNFDFFYFLSSNNQKHLVQNLKWKCGPIRTHTSLRAAGANGNRYGPGRYRSRLRTLSGQRARAVSMGRRWNCPNCIICMHPFLWLDFCSTNQNTYVYVEYILIQIIKYFLPYFLIF
jgi:hypothetical protein